MTLVKICGLITQESMTAAIDAGADYVGLNFFHKSPRYASPELAYELALPVPEHVETVGLFVNPDDALLDEVVSKVPLDILQFHGQETPERLAEIRSKYQRKIMKVLPVSHVDDLKAVSDFESVSDLFLFDAKAPAHSALPGGNGITFDWQILEKSPTQKPWLLAGGLTPDNVSQAIQLTRAPGVDVSSGVETEPGQKNAQKIRDFIQAARQA